MGIPAQYFSSSFILMISLGPFITPASTRIGEILRATLVSRWIFSGFLYNGKRENEQIPAVLIPKSRALFWLGNLQKGSTRACGRGGQTYWSESDGPEETGVFPGSSMPFWTWAVSWSILETLDPLLFGWEFESSVREKRTYQNTEILAGPWQCSCAMKCPENPTHRNYWQTWRLLRWHTSAMKIRQP